MTEHHSPAVSIHELSVRYGSTVALDRVSLAVEPATVYALLGRNGAGKSSLVRVLLGQQQSSSGTSTLLGADPWRRRTELMTRVGVVPEDPDAPESMTVSELVRFSSKLYPRWRSSTVSSRLEHFELPLGTPFARLSKGQKAQVMLSLALGHEPELLVLDDPTLGIDAVARRAVYSELITELAERGTTVVITSHDLSGVESIADRIGILHHGSLILDEPLEAIKERFRLVLLRCHHGTDPATILHQLTPVSMSSGELGTEALVSAFNGERWAAIERHAGVASADVRAASLEQLFVALTNHSTGGDR